MVMMIIITIAIALIEEQKTFTFKIFFFWKGYGSFPFLLLHFLKFLVYILLWTRLGWINYSTGVNIKKMISNTK